MKENMKGLDDKHIEQMMQDAAQNFVPVYNPNAWAQMQTKMVAAGMTPAAPTSPWIVLIRIIVGVILILSIAGGLYFYLGDSVSNMEPIEPTITESTNTNQPDALKNISSDKQNGVLKDNSTNQLANDESVQPRPTEKSGLYMDSLKQNKGEQTASKSFPEKKITNGKASVFSDISNEIVGEIKIERPTTLGNQVVDEVGMQMKVINVENSENSEASSAEIPVESFENVTENFEDHTSLFFNRLELKEINEVELKEYSQFDMLKLTADTSVVTQEIVGDNTKRRGKRFAVSFLVSPDFSGAKVSKLKGTGIGVGLMFEYLVTDRISINSGIQYGSKKYFVDDGFEGYADRWPGRPEPDEVDASCTVIDIPINVKYYFYDNGRTRIFLNSGVTSYIMLTEDYLYKYNSSSIEDWAVSIENENKHFFGLMNFSFGIQKSVGKGFYVVAEPFYKVPIRGIGAGKVNLNSSGLYLSIKKEF